MTAFFVGLLLVVGALFMFVAGLGVLRMPDVLLRMSATTKSVTLGTGCMLGAAALYFQDLSITTRALATLAFLVATAPVAAHKIARAAYVSRVPLWQGMKVDELRDQFRTGTEPREEGEREPDE